MGPDGGGRGAVARRRGGEAARRRGGDGRLGEAGGGERGRDAHLIAAHVAGLDQAERVVDAERREDAEVALGEHGDRRAGGRRAHGGRVEGGSEGDSGEHDCSAARAELGVRAARRGAGCESRPVCGRPREGVGEGVGARRARAWRAAAGLGGGATGGAVCIWDMRVACWNEGSGIAVLILAQLTRQEFLVLVGLFFLFFPTDARSGAGGWRR